MGVSDGLKRAWYRTFQEGLNIGARALYWRKPETVTGEGCAAQIPAIMKKEGVRRVMVVTGRHVGKSIAPGIIENLKNAGVDCVHFSEVEANPSTTTVDKIVWMYRLNNCDGFLAIGGGSPIDAAKAAAALVACPGRTLAQMAGLFRVLRRLPPFVAVPTTAGTGSETTIAAVITDAATHHKYAVMDICLVPRYAVLDPVLTRDLPPKSTSTTGMDALTHAVEAYLCWTNRTKEVDRDAEEATVTIFKYLERAYRDGNDMEARDNMLMAAFKAGFAFTRAGVGNVHAIAHTLGGLYNVPHGLANAVILPIVLEDYGARVYKRLARLAEITGTRTDGTDEDKAKAFIAEIYAMNARMGIPRGIEGIKEEDIPQMVDWALAEANPTYPVPVVYTREHCAQVIRRIML